MPDVGNKGLKIIFPSNLPIYHSKRACALCEHVSWEPDLSLRKEVQQQLLASARGLLFFSFPPFPSQKPCSTEPSSEQPSRSLPLLSLPPCQRSELPGSWEARLPAWSLIGKMDSRMLSDQRFCRRIFAAALCVLVLLADSGCARNLWKRALHLKMTEKYDVSRLRWGGLGGLGVLTARWKFSLRVCFRIRSVWIHTPSLYKRAAWSFPSCTKLLPPSCCDRKLVQRAENTSVLRSSLLFLQTS